MEKAVKIIERLHEEQGDLVASKRKLRQADGVTMVRLKRDNGRQEIAFSTRPFVLCGLPVRRPPVGQRSYVRRNGSLILEIDGSSRYGLPFGQDRLIPIYLATLAVRQKSPVIRFESAAHMLDTFGLQQGGKEYKRLIEGFQRIFGATIFFGTEDVRQKANLFMMSRFNFLKSAKLWYVKDVNQCELFPDEEGNVVVLTDEFFKEITTHPIPCDLQAVKVLSSKPALLDLFIWLSYRCYTAKGEERIPLFGDFGLVQQLGTTEYTRPRKFREKLSHWLKEIAVMWPQCPADISSEGDFLIVRPAHAIHSRAQLQ